jgi:hypothetical protein
MDSYSVSTSLTLDDKLIAGLKQVAAQLRTANKDFDKLKSAARAGFSVRPAGVDKLRAELATATGAAGKLRSALTGVKLSSAAASGASALAHNLSTAQNRASALARTLARLRMPAGGASGTVPPSGPWGPRGGGRGPGGGGHSASPWGHGVLDRGFMHSVFDVMMIGQAAGFLFKPAMEFGHQRFLATQMGESPEDRERMQRAAYETARKVPNQSVGELMKLQRELLPIAAMGMKPGESAVRKMIEHLPEAAEIDTLLSNYLGEKAGTRSHRMSEYYSLLRAGETLGLSGDQLHDFVRGGTSSIIAGGGKITAESLRQVVAKGGLAAIGMDPNTILQQSPELILEQGGPAVGTMFATMAKSAAGRTPLASAKEFERLGLINPGALSFKDHKARIAEGGWQDETKRFTNQGLWMIENLAPALLRNMGVNTAGMTQEQISQRISTGPGGLTLSERGKLMREMSILFSDRNAAKGAEQFMLQARQIERFFARYQQARLGTIAEGRANDPDLAMEGLKGSFETLRTALLDPQLSHSLGIMNLAADAMTSLSNAASRDPLSRAITKASMDVGGLTAAVLALGIAARGVVFAGGGLASIGRGAAAVAAAAGIGAGTAGGAAALAGAAAATGAAIGVAKETTRRAKLGDFTSYNAIDPPIDPFGLATAAGAVDRPRRPGRSRAALSTAANAGFAPPGTEFPIPPATGSAKEYGPPAPGGAGDAAGHLGGIAASINAAVGALQAAAGRPVNLSGQVTLSGDVHVSMGELGAAIGHMIARGLAHAASGGMTSGGARPDFSGGPALHPPT